MRLGVITKYIGIVLLIDSVFMLIAAVISFLNGIDSGFFPLLLSFVLTVALGSFPLIFVRKTDYMTTKEGYCVVIFAWLLSCLVGMFPYYMWGGEFTFGNAWFESVSGFTTTGATILSDIEALPKGLLFWRSSTHWIGGLGVIMFALTILPSMGRNRMMLSNVELSSIAKDNYKYTTKKIARILMLIYLSMTGLLFFFLTMSGMNWFDAINHAFSTVATGGFSTKNASIGAFDSALIESILMVFMFLSGIHFGLIFATLSGNRNNLFRSEVVRFYFLSVLTGAVFVSLSIWQGGMYDSLGESIRHGLFQTVSIASTTGYATANTNLWTPFAIAILMYFTFQCACAGSTSGGIKCDRILLAFKVIRARITQQQHPRAIIRIKMSGVVQDEGILNFAMLYIVVYILFVVVGTLVNTACGLDFMTAISAAATCMGSVGPGFGKIGSLDNFANIPDIAKFTNTMLMLFGRLEIFGLIQIFFIRRWV